MKHNMLLSLLLCLAALTCAEPVECMAQAQQHHVSVKGNSQFFASKANKFERSIVHSPFSILHSQLSSDQRLVGYTVTDAIDVSGAAFGKAGTYSVGAVLTPQMLASYEGCRVVGIRVAAALNLGLSRTYIYDVSELGIVAQVEQYQRLYEGWNEVFFNGDGYVIQGSETLFFGFDYKETDEMVSNDQGGLCGAGDEQEGSFYCYGDLGKGEGLYSLSGLGRLCVQLIVDVSSLPMLDMDMTYLDAGFKYKQPGETVDAYLAFANIGRAALANGGFFGQGLFRGSLTQNGGVPEGQNDFIFVSIGEELGIVGCLAVIILLCIICIRCLKAARLCRKESGKIIAVGFFAMMFAQMFINLGMCLALLPVIGVTLPFFSAGGTSLVCV